MTRVAAVDIGTNSVRLLIGDANDAGGIDVLDRRMRITRLGQGVDATRRLHPDAIARTVAVLDEYRAAIDEHGVRAVRAAATSAARDAENRDDFFAVARAALGTEPELLAGDDEAALSFAGATAGLPSDLEAPYLVLDIGGGSTEFVVGIDAPDGLVSLDIGSVRLTEQFLHSDPPAPEELSDAVSVVRDHLADVDRALPAAASARTLIGVAGTITTIAAIELGLTEYRSDRLHHFALSRAAAEDVFRTLATETLAERRHNPGLDPGRADVIVGGAIILVSVLRHYGFAEVVVSESDILDGLARSLLPAP
ncbi:MAG TPA: Ppx/GppA phosphatase family protein [Acidimicrobiia bacterium]|nr:Ppx/GppA phosphatase family protein [Acidimicrobiia bacterium]